MELHETVNGTLIHSFRDSMMGGYPVRVTRPGYRGLGSLEGFVSFSTGEAGQKRAFESIVARIRAEALEK
jgi:hypothetical protein